MYQLKAGRTLYDSAMDAGDMDGNGDTDIALGFFVYFIPDSDTTGLGKK